MLLSDLSIKIGEVLDSFKHTDAWAIFFVPKFSFMILVLPLFSILVSCGFKFAAISQMTVDSDIYKSVDMKVYMQNVQTRSQHFIYYSSIMFYVLVLGSIITMFLYQLYTSQSFELILYSWIDTTFMSIDISFLYDSLTLVMLFVVVFISFLVHVFSIDYMLKDPHLFRFLSYLSLFTFFMIILITSSNFLQLFVGWEGVGLCSYLLINFWYTRIPANKSAIKAIIVNRIGDCGLIFACSVIYSNFRTLKYSVIFSLISCPEFYLRYIYIFSYKLNLVTFICLLLFLAAVGKSAQIGLHTWLPDAMEGPTPVSALIHAATMVTAGVFLIIRCSILFEYTDTVLFLMILFGSFTAFLGSTVGLFQYDIKKVIAYSTCSQLGYMIFSCGMSGYSTTLYHLANHAFFKALLFLSAGVIIHALSDEQDMRRFGNLRKLLPLVYIFFLIASLALCGFPFYAGWYSKDIIIETSFLNDILISARFCYWLGTLATFFTAFYSFRLVYLTFEGQFSGFKSYLFNFHEPSKLAFIPLIILTFASLFSGYLMQSFFNLFYSTFFNNVINVLPTHTINIEFEFLPFYIKLVPSFYTILALFLTLYTLNHLNFPSKSNLKLFLSGNLNYQYEIFCAKKNLPDITFNKFFYSSTSFSRSILHFYEFYFQTFSISYLVNFLMSGFLFFFYFLNLIFYFVQVFIIILTNLPSFIRVYIYYGFFWNIFIFFHKKWHFDYIYNIFINKNILKISYDIFFKLVDKGLLEFFGPKGMHLFIIKLSKTVEFLHIGNLYNMLTYSFYGILFFVLCFDYIFI